MTTYWISLTSTSIVESISTEIIIRKINHFDYLGISLVSASVPCLRHFGFIALGLTQGAMSRPGAYESPAIEHKGQLILK
jgi:hypothetical protein